MTLWMADIFDQEGVCAYWRTEELNVSLTRHAVKKMVCTEAFERFSEIVGRDQARAFLVARSARLIRPLAESCTLATMLPYGDPRAPKEAVTNDPIIHGILREVWPTSPAVLRLGNPQGIRANPRASVRRWLSNLWRATPCGGGFSQAGDQAALGVEINPVDMTRGVAPYKFANISPERIVLCFNHPYYQVSKQELSNYERTGLKWVSLAKGSIEGSRMNWRPGPLRNGTATQYRRGNSRSLAADDLERWVASAAVSQLRRVDHWRAFLNRHNIRVFLLLSGGAEEKIAKRMATNLEEALLVTSQRSHFVSRGDTVGNRSSDIAFCWGDPDAAVGQFNENYIDHVVVTGFTGEDAFSQGRFEGNEHRRRLSEAGARFVIGLFDNGFEHKSMYSRSGMTAFYRHFLTWVLAAPDRGLVIKPKREDLATRHSEIEDLLTAAQATGRCLILGHESGPHVAALIADLCVGIGHSTAVAISAIAGCRAVHCDLGGTPNHPLASWGMGRVLFHDLGILGQEIERHMQDPVNSELGDFSPGLDNLDPFRDGGANERIAEYLRWLLEAFDQRMDRYQAMQAANEQYVRDWGSDKVISYNSEVLNVFVPGRQPAQFHVG